MSREVIMTDKGAKQFVPIHPERNARIALVVNPGLAQLTAGGSA